MKSLINNIKPISFVVFTLISITFLYFLDNKKENRAGDNHTQSNIAIRDTIPSNKTNISKDRISKDARGDFEKPESEGHLLSQIESEFINASRQRYLNQIGNKLVQVKFIENLSKFLQEIYPETWKDEMERMLGSTFPNVGNELFETFIKLEEYQTQISKKREAFSNLTAEDRRRQTWELRESLFGEQAYEIWEATYKNEKLTSSLMEISQQQHLPINQRFENYVDAIHSIYDSQAEQLISSKQQEVMDRFLTVSSNQNTLEALPVEERHQQLRTLREKLGMNEEALQRWDTLDSKRHKRWELGQTYMQERTSIEDYYSGRERDEKIDALRKSMFGERAKSLAAEEASGYYRFSGKQLYGIN